MNDKEYQAGAPAYGAYPSKCHSEGIELRVLEGIAV
jgi:hypothetical protein